MFLANATAEANRLRLLMDRGVLPRTTFLAMSSVGVIPYVTGAPTLDRLGLTDATVAHGPFTNGMMAHGKLASLDYARQRGVDLWFCDPVFAHEPLLSQRMLATAIRSRRWLDDGWAAEVAPDTFLLCLLPRGPGAASRRMPRLHFQSLRDSVFSREYFARAIAAERDRMHRDPHDPEAVAGLASLYIADGRYREAEPLCRWIVSAAPEDAAALDQFAACQLGRGDLRGAVQTVRRQLELVARAGDPRAAAAVEHNLRALESLLENPKPFD
jgi:hypothetical protein